MHQFLLVPALIALSVPLAIAGDPPQEYGNYLSHRYRTQFPVGARYNSEETDASGGVRSHYINLGGKATACFDTGTLGYCAWWTGGFVDLGQTHHLRSKGQRDPQPVGTVRMGMDAAAPVNPRLRARCRPNCSMLACWNRRPTGRRSAPACAPNSKMSYQARMR